MSFDQQGDVPVDDDDPGKSLAKKAKKSVDHLILVPVHHNCLVVVKFHCQVDLFPGCFIEICKCATSSQQW